MKNILFYFSGTGNSLAMARYIAKELHDTEIVSILHPAANNAAIGSSCIGFIFPVYIWGLPLILRRFLAGVELPSNSYLFAIAACGGQSCGALKQARRLLRRRGKKLDAGFELKLPNNYVPLGIPNEEKQRAMIEAAIARSDAIITSIQLRETAMHKGWPLLNWLFSGVLYSLSAPHIPKMDKSFRADERCNGCEICAKICPVENISIEKGKPVWQHRCEQCWACFHWCPQKAVQSGKKSAGKRRYHHPEVTLKDMTIR